MSDLKEFRLNREVLQSNLKSKQKVSNQIFIHKIKSRTWFNCDLNQHTAHRCFYLWINKSHVANQCPVTAQLSPQTVRVGTDNVLQHNDTDITTQTGFPLFYWQKNPELFQDPREKFSRTFSWPANVYNIKKQEIWANAHETRHSISLILYVCRLGLSQ